MALGKYTQRSIPAGFRQFTGGLNSTAGALGVANNESSLLQNVDFDKFGSILKRSGYTAANTVALNSSARITGLHFYELSTGTRNLVTVAGNKTYYWGSGSISGAPTDITGAITITAGNLVDAATFRDTALYTNGTDAPWQWTGTGNAAAMTVPATLTKAKFVKVFQNYTFLANVTVGGTAFASRVYYSNINSISTWTATDFVDVSRDDGQTITGLKVLGDKLVIFKDRSIWVAQFTGDADIPFQFSPSNSAVGCVSHFSIQEVDNMLVFLSWDGIYVFDGFNAYKVSEKINTTFFTDLAPSKFSNAVSMFQHTKDRYWLAVTSSGATTNDTVITWTNAKTTVATDAFSVYKGIAASQMCMTNPDGITENPYFGDYSGFVYKSDTGMDDYPLNVKTAINAYYYTNWIHYDDICDQKGLISAYVYYNNNSGTLTFVYSYDFNDGDTYSYSINTSTGTSVWDTAVWDTATWVGGGGGISRVDLDGRGRLVRFGFKNSNQTESFRVDGIGTLAYLETNV